MGKISGKEIIIQPGNRLKQKTDVPKCHHCGMPVESSNYALKGMAVRCRYCGFSELPLSSGACFYDKLNMSSREHPDRFSSELAPSSVYPKLALVSLFLFFASIWSVEMRPFTMASLLGFVLFALISAFLRLRDSA